MSEECWPAHHGDRQGEVPPPPPDECLILQEDDFWVRQESTFYLELEQCPT